MPDAQPIPEAYLEVVESAGSRRRVRLTASPFLIGRGAEAGNHLQLSDRRISRACAAIVYADGTYCLEDRGQRLGVFANNQEVDRHPLSDGDTITFGAADSVKLVFRKGTAQESLPRILSRLDQASGLGTGARDLRHLSLLLEATALLQSQLPLEEILGAMVDRAVAVTEADRGLLLEADSGGELGPLVARQRDGQPLSAASMEPSQTAIGHALAQRRSVVEQDLAQAEAALREAQSIVAQNLRSVIAIPLLSLPRTGGADVTFIATPGELLGVLYLDSRRPAAFSGLERQILDALAREAASVLDNARLVQKERERQRLEQELSIARRIQQALLPKTFQDFRHLKVTGVSRSCLEVGGDYFDLMELGNGRIAFVIADVSGKGLGAAMVTAMLQGTFSAMTLGQEPASVFAHVNRFICSHSEVGRYATLFFGVLESDGRLEFINSGHPPPLMIRSGSVEPAFKADSPPLGLLPLAEFKRATATLDAGDSLVLYTDGITEAMNSTDEEFGEERLRDVVAKHAQAPIDEIQSAVLRAVENFTRGRPQADDVTLLILRYTGRA